jgi:hypothetical protein
LKYVNELSTTIDLPSTRVRAESLFYKFQRVIEAADRKHALAAPGEGGGEMRRRRTESREVEGSSTRSVESAPDVTVNKGKSAEVNGGEAVPNVSSELRALLSRDIIRAK